MNVKARIDLGRRGAAWIVAAGGGPRWRISVIDRRPQPGAPDRADAGSSTATSTRFISARRSTKSPRLLPRAVPREARRRHRPRPARRTSRRAECRAATSPSLAAAARKLSCVLRAARHSGCRGRRRRAADQQVVRAARVLDHRQEHAPISVRITRPFADGGAPLHFHGVGAVDAARTCPPRASRSARRWRAGDHRRGAAPRRAAAASSCTSRPAPARG